MADLEHGVTDPLDDGTASVQSHTTYTRFSASKSCFAVVTNGGKRGENN